MAKKTLEAARKQIKRAQKRKANARFYNLNSLLGNDWAMFYCICGSRMTGKSYALSDFLCRRKHKLEDMCKNYWLRISETSTKALLMNKAENLIDPDLQRKWDLELSTKGGEVFNHGKKFMTVLPLSQFGKLKGQAYFDKDYQGEYNIVLDEFQLETGEKATSFSVLYAFIAMIETIARTTKNKIRIFLVGNTLEEASTILKAFNFLPQKFGRFYLKSKKCVIDNIEPTEEYFRDREGSAADILGGKDMSNYSNELSKDTSMIYDGPLKKPTGIIKFGKSPGDWYAIWDNKIIRRYKNEKVAADKIIAMWPGLDVPYSTEKRKTVIDLFNAKYWKFKNLIDQAYFKDALSGIQKMK